MNDLYALPLLAKFCLAAIFVFAPGARASVSVEIDLQEQRAYLLRDGYVFIESPISSGRTGFHTRPGKFKVLEKDMNHRSSIYGKIVDRSGRTIEADADIDMPVPPGAKFVSAPMHFFIRFDGANGMHAGLLPGYPASHGCVRLPKERAAVFYQAVEIGTPVTVFGRTPVYQWELDEQRERTRDRGRHPFYDRRQRRGGPLGWW